MRLESISLPPPPFNVPHMSRLRVMGQRSDCRKPANTLHVDHYPSGVGPIQWGELASHPNRTSVHNKEADK